jgi:hypothetical protein
MLQYSVLDKSAWYRLGRDLKYHPFMPIRRSELEPKDQFCQWLLTLTEVQLLEILISDESNFPFNGHVNSQDIRFEN